MASSVPVPLALGRFKQLPQRSTEVWQGGLVKLPVWIDNPDNPEGPPHRASGAFWASARTGLIHVDLPSTLADLSPQLALSALLDFGLKHAKQLEGRPARLEVADPAVRDQLADALAGMSTDVVVVPDLPLVRAALGHLEEHERGGVRPRGLLEMEGMTIERVRAFADAAARFHRAAVGPSRQRGFARRRLPRSRGSKGSCARSLQRPKTTWMLDAGSASRHDPTCVRASPSRSRRSSSLPGVKTRRSTTIARSWS